VVKVLDFGISKVSKQSALDEKPEQLTSTKAMLGSPLYMSPEQLRSSKTVDHRADIWAVGVILYELLTNTVPFHGDTLGELFAAILDATPVAPSSRNPSLPPGLDAIILRCLRLRADERYASCADLKRELAPFASAQGHTMLASTAFMPGAPSGFPQGGRVTGPAAMTPPGGGFQHPQQVPMGAAATGSGVHPPVVKAMGPMSSTPQPGWGNTTGAGVPKSNGPIVAIGALAALLVLGAVGGAMALYATKHKATAASSASAPSETPPEPPPPASVVTAPPPPATGTAPDTSASTSASVATNNGKPPLSGHGPKTPPVKDPPKAQDPPKIAETPPPPRPPPPATATKPPSGTGLSPELSR
ncbi:MAG TPA: serine/threonine-protein kinase, partial [Labilithrix sp.]